jgi:uncharacterized protein (TIGR04255 family)
VFGVVGPVVEPQHTSCRTGWMAGGFLAKVGRYESAADTREYAAGRVLGPSICFVAQAWYDPADFPQFAHPPVTETAMGLEFAPNPELGFVRLTRLQTKWADRYPILTEMPAVPTSAQMAPGYFEISNSGPPVRVWAQAESNGLLVQTQSDRLILNWRSAYSNGAPYPSYPKLRDYFENIWDDFKEFITDEKLQPPAPISVEYTYVNQIQLAEDESLEDVFAILKRSDRELPGDAAATQLQIVRNVQPTDEGPFSAQIVIATTPQGGNAPRVIGLNITTKVLVAGLDPLEAMDAAHALSSHTFANITSESKHEEWDRS